MKNSPFTEIVYVGVVVIYSKPQDFIVQTVGKWFAKRTSNRPFRHLFRGRISTRASVILHKGVRAEYEKFVQYAILTFAFVCDIIYM